MRLCIVNRMVPFSGMSTVFLKLVVKAHVMMSQATTKTLFQIHLSVGAGAAIDMFAHAYADPGGKNQIRAQIQIQLHIRSIFEV